MEDGDRSPGCGARKEGCNARQEDWSFQKGLEAATTKNVTVLLALFHKLSCCKVASVGASSMCFRLELLLHFFVTAACKSQKVNPPRTCGTEGKRCRCNVYAWGKIRHCYCDHDRAGARLQLFDAHPPDTEEDVEQTAIVLTENKA